MRRFLVSIVSVPLASVSSASAGFVFEQPPLPGGGIASQEFPNLSSYSCACLDDFTLTERIALGSLRIFGLDDTLADPSANLDVRVSFHVGPDLGSAVAATFHGVQVDDDLLFDLGGTFLEAGNYWIAAQVVRPFESGQQWYWQLSDTANGGQAVFHNPGGGFGFGTVPIPVSGLGSGAHDMAFRLEFVPAPGAWAALALAGTAARRRR